MKKFIFKIFFFTLPILVLIYPLDYGISYYLSQSNQSPGEFEVMNDIYNSKANCEVAIYGSSRAWGHIDPLIIADSLNLNTYNFGIDGHGFWLQYLRHIELLRYNVKPVIILLETDIYSLQKRVDLYQPDQFLPYMLWNENIEEFTCSYIGYNRIDYYVPLIRYTGKVQALSTSIKMLITGKANKRYRNNGYLGMDMKWNSDFETANTIQQSYEVKLDTPSLKLFETFIQECKSMNIDLVLVYTPEYIEYQSFASNRMEVVNIYKNLAKQHELPFYDYSNDEICYYKSLFYNARHLNRTGAEVFTKKLARDLKARIQYRKSDSPVK